jgi:uncharacterized small protein (DUF1192 family)
MYKFVLPILVMLSSNCFSQSLKLDEETLINITDQDMSRGIGRYKDFFVTVKQGDQLTFDVKGAGGVAVPTAVHLFETESVNSRNYSQISESLQWTSKPLPTCKLKVRIVAYRPYGELSVYITRENPADARMKKSASPSDEGRADLSSMTIEELRIKLAKLRLEIETLEAEIAKRKSTKNSSK